MLADRVMRSEKGSEFQARHGCSLSCLVVSLSSHALLGQRTGAFNASRVSFNARTYQIPAARNFAARLCSVRISSTGLDRERRMPARLVASEKPTRGALTRRNMLTGMAALTSGSPAFGRKASQLSDLDAAFDDERKRLGVPSVGVVLVEDGRVRLHQRGLRDNVVAMNTPYQ